MKAPLCSFIAITWLLGLAAVAQNPNAPEPNLALTSFAAPGPSLHLSYNAALPSDPRFALPPDTPGESSSRRHSGNANASGPTTPTDPTTAAPGAPGTPCEKPAGLASMSEYSGPLNRLAARISRRPELSTVSAHRKSGNKICSLDAGEKFALFAKTTLDPLTFIGAGISAGESQWNNDDREFGQGAEEYGRRYGAAFADRASWNFFGKFFYPAVFRQDPRYYRKGNGTTGERISHALAHTLVARSDSGHNMPNFSLWTSTASTVALSNLYHPGNDRGFGSAAQRTGIGIGTSMGFDVLKEFWPEIVCKLHLPFTERRVAPARTIAKP